jgi:hypothetical protein
MPGDHWVRPLARRIIRGKARLSGIDRVFHNLCRGLDRLGVEYFANLRKESKADNRVGVMDRGRSFEVRPSEPNRSWNCAHDPSQLNGRHSVRIIWRSAICGIWHGRTIFTFREISQSKARSLDDMP